MDEHGDKVFSIWNGVFQGVSGIIRYALAGHHPSLLISPRHNGEHEVVWLEATGIFAEEQEVFRPLKAEPQWSRGSLSYSSSAMACTSCRRLVVR